MLLGLGYFGLFLGCLLAATIIPFPADVLIVGLFEAGYNVYLVIAVALIGATIGTLTNYFIGYKCNTEKLNKRFKLNQEKIAKWQRRFDKWGVWLGLLSSAPFIGAPMIAVLGYFKVKVIPLTITIVLGRIVRYVLLTLIYYSII